MDIYTQTNYKAAIKTRVKELGASKKKMSLQKLAARIPIQNTYLSKALNSEKTHLNEDHLFKVCQLLEFFPEETDFIFLLKAKSIATEPSRRNYLESKISRYRQERLRNATFQEFNTRQLTQEMNYLFDPLCTLVQVALFIPEYQSNPRKLCSVLGVSSEKLKQILNKLRDLDYIKIDDNGFSILEVKQNQIHYGTDHPLMRTQQNYLRNKSTVHLNQISEEEKHSFMGTFSADDETFQNIKSRFRNFLKEAETLIAKAPSKKIFQMNFDLFNWF